jgi:protein SCO1/2
MKSINKNLLLIAIFIATVLGLFINKLTTPRTLSDDELLVNGLFLFDEPKLLSDFEFISSNKKIFSKSDLMGKWTLMYFGFTKCPDECPTTMYQLSKLIKVLRDKEYKLDDKQWILVSIDPERDTPEMIDNYAKGFDKDFIGVSNNRPMLLSLATQLSVNNVMPSSSNHMDHSHLDNHVNNIILLDPNGDFAGIFRPPFDVSRLSLTYQSVTN